MNHRPYTNPKATRKSSDKTNDSSASLIADPFAEVDLFISHELRTPLTSIQGVLRLLNSGHLGSLSEEGHRLVAIAIHNTNRLTRLANAIEHKTVSPKITLAPEQVKHLQLENDLHKAIERQELQIVYHPIRAFHPDRVIGFEALARWTHPHKGVIQPDVFIPLAEQSEAIRKLGLWVLQQACEQLSSWQRVFPGPSPLSMSVNLSALQLLHPHLLREVQQVLEHTGIAPNSLRLEITETTFIENHRFAIANLSGLKSMGVQIYIDDFGTGYSSLTKLQNLPISGLKIDPSFVRGKRWDVSKAIVSLAAELDLDVVAEGVETLEELTALQTLGCCQMQGYLFSKPMDKQEASLLVTSEAKTTQPNKIP